ncbi:hypothetical protein BGW38_003473 [Lunasporangiospora selenospora]|uniref:Superoxide dismutase copper/zinc binding domain-containing protein n=1 Tax=Lunasporangiospora selenospora TaxID=979761 RepID=A0A9P6FQM1_9FUNG|nr:hypothetical protein BGW38_003473 [Lunasporangiospora selenospora]
MLFKPAAAVLALAGLAAAQTKEYTKGVANVDMNGVKATFTFEKVAEGMNITVAVQSGLNTTAQKLPSGFDYHVHVSPVGPNNNCSSTGLHLDPAKVGVAKPCNPSDLTTCQTGDLAGKFGNLNATADGSITTFSYVDKQLNFTGAGPEGALLGRSIVIHNNITRYACADIVVEGYKGTDGNGTTTPPKGDGKSSATKLVGSIALTAVAALFALAL